MTRDEEAPSPALFDRRTVERNIKRGLTTRKDYEKYLKSLPDAAGNVLPAEELTQESADSAADAGRPEPTPPATVG
jgi:2-oxo-4-hydroxy-4-carboxy--5-ureidoimidazoline (OHCU) decarboxylase